MADEKKPITDEAKASSMAAAALIEGDKPVATESTPKVRRKKVKRLVKQARVCIHAGENNTIVTITDQNGATLAWASSGSSGFEGTRKSTPYSAKVAAENAVLKAAAFGIESVTVEVKGIGPGREQAIRGLQGVGLNLDAIIDVTPIPHGGCRPSRRRRV